MCSSDPAGLARLFQPYQDPLNLIWVQTRFREGIVFSGLMYVIRDMDGKSLPSKKGPCAFSPKRLITSRSSVSLRLDLPS